MGKWTGSDTTGKTLKVTCEFEKRAKYQLQPGAYGAVTKTIKNQTDASPSEHCIFISGAASFAKTGPAKQPFFFIFFISVDIQHNWRSNLQHIAVSVECDAFPQISHVLKRQQQLHPTRRTWFHISCCTQPKGESRYSEPHAYINGIT